MNKIERINEKTNPELTETQTEGAKMNTEQKSQLPESMENNPQHPSRNQKPDLTPEQQEWLNNVFIPRLRAQLLESSGHNSEVDDFGRPLARVTSADLIRQGLIEKAEAKRRQ